MVELNDNTPQLKAVKKLADACTSGNVEDAEPVLSKDFRFKTFPETAQLPDLTKDKYIQTYGKIFASLAKMEIIYHDVIEATGKVVLHHTGVFTTIGGVTLDCDSVFIISFVEEDGELKLLEIKDFSDNEKRKAFHDEIAKPVV